MKRNKGFAKTALAAGLGGVLVVAGAYAYVTLRKHQSALPPITCADEKPTPKIVAFGDSLVEGYGAPAGSDFVSVLAKMVGVPIINAGVSGDTTAQGLARLQAVIDQKPDVVLVLLGGNDAIQKVPRTTTESNLSQIIERLQARGSRVVLLGVTGGLLQDPYQSLFESLAAKYQVAYVPNVLSGLIEHEQYMSDVVHPNAAGYQKIAEKVYPALEASCAAFAPAAGR